MNVVYAETQICLPKHSVGFQ